MIGATRVLPAPVIGPPDEPPLEDEPPHAVTARARASAAATVRSLLVTSYLLRLIIRVLSPCARLLTGLGPIFVATLSAAPGQLVICLYH